MKLVSFKTPDTETVETSDCGINPEEVTHIIAVETSLIKVKFVDGSYITVVGDYESVRKKLARGINEETPPAPSTGG